MEQKEIQELINTAIANAVKPLNDIITKQNDDIKILNTKIETSKKVELKPTPSKKVVRIFHTNSFQISNKSLNSDNKK